MRLAGKVAVVVGSGRGIGAVTVRRFAAEGASVVVADLIESSAEEVAAGIRESGGVAHAAAVDVTDEASVEALFTTTAEHFGGIDIVHNNAVIRDPAEATTGVAGVDAAVWDRVMAVGLRGYMLGCKHALPHLIRRGGGSIVNMSSIVALAPLTFSPAYASAKGGIISLTRSVATSYGRKGIRCNAICPGFIVTEATSSNHDNEFRAMVMERVPAQRLGTPTDIASLALFLASDESAYITGQVIAIDGGLTVASALFSELPDVSGVGI